MTPNEVSVSLLAASTKPIYNVKAVCVRTAIPAATLRAWERRYGIPQPNRTEQGYRLYSDRDVAALLWLKNQTENGVNIAHASAQLRRVIESGADVSLIEAIGVSDPLPIVQHAPRSPGLLRDEVISALVHLDERTFDRLMNEAHALYTVETTLITILHGAVNVIRAMRQADEITTATATLAIRFAHQRLMQMAQTLPNARGGYKPVVAIGFAQEHNEFEMMVITVLLRRQGIPVTQLGTDLEPHMLQEAVAHMHTGLIVFYADDPRNVIRLSALTELRNAAFAPVPVYCGGLALDRAPELQAHLRVRYIGPDLRDTVRAIIAWCTQIADHQFAANAS